MRFEKNAKGEILTHICEKCGRPFKRMADCMRHEGICEQIKNGRKVKLDEK